MPEHRRAAPLDRNAPREAYEALFALWSRLEGEPEPAVFACLGRVLQRFERDRERFTDILEPSLSFAGGRASLRRLSYAFPGFRADPAGCGAALRALGEPFGEAALAQVDRALRASRHPAVAQPLFGLADEGPGALRIKLYLQFHDEAGSAAVALAEQVLGARLRGRLPARGGLHLLGLDLSAGGGLVGAKLYLRHGRVALDEAAARIGPAPIFDALAASGARALREVLAIHRLEGPDDPAVERTAEIDFAVQDAGIGWAALRGLLPAKVRAEGGALAALEAALPLRARRLSAPVGPGDKFNLYYVINVINMDGSA